MSFLNSIKNQSKKHEFPFDHWEYNNALTDDAIKEIIKALNIAFLFKKIVNIHQITILF